MTGEARGSGAAHFQRVSIDFYLLNILQAAPPIHYSRRASLMLYVYGRHRSFIRTAALLFRVTAPPRVLGRFWGVCVCSYIHTSLPFTSRVLLFVFQPVCQDSGVSRGHRTFARSTKVLA